MKYFCFQIHKVCNFDELFYVCDKENEEKRKRQAFWIKKGLMNLLNIQGVY